MKIFNLKVGDKKSGRAAVKVPLQVAENSADMIALAKNDEAVAVRCFNRGWKIENQERSGARDAFKEGKDEAAIAQIVATYDPTKVAERGPRTPKAPPTVKLAQKSRYTLEELQAALAAAGVTLDTGAEQAAKAGAGA